jgi:hypothetical protein
MGARANDGGPDLDDGLGDEGRSTGSSDRHRSTRRRFLGWATGAVVGSSALVGKLVGFRPTPAYGAGSCIMYDDLNCDFSCYGAYDTFQSCCRTSLRDDYCCCTCYEGPGVCTPKLFRSHAVCKTFNSLCCCTT